MPLVLAPATLGAREDIPYLPLADYLNAIHQKPQAYYLAQAGNPPSTHLVVLNPVRLGARAIGLAQLSIPTDEIDQTLRVDRQLASAYGRDQYRYTQPPFVHGVPEQGYQAKDTPREIYRAGLKMPGRFHELSAGKQDARLKEIEGTLFFSMLRGHTIEGMFCDPMHGGNIDLIGWQLIGFPGPRMSYVEEVEQYHGRPFRPKPASLSQILGHPVRPSEDDV